MAIKFFKCPICGNVIVKLVDSGVVPVCCGEAMQLLEAGVTDGAHEKHVPVVTRTDRGTLQASVGQVAHPMLPEHHICFIAAETRHGVLVHQLTPGEPAQAEFCDITDEVVAVYEYCNLHGLWMTTDIPTK